MSNRHLKTKKFAIMIGISLLFPSLCLANPQIAKSNPEKLIDAVNLGEDFSKLSKPSFPLNGTPEIPNEKICAKPDLLDDRIDCRYQTVDGLIYRIDDKGKIYEIIMQANVQGKFPKKLPLGIKNTISQKALIKKIEKLGLERDSSYSNNAKRFYVNACILTTEPKGKETCFHYNKSMKIYKMSIFLKHDDE